MAAHACGLKKDDKISIKDLLHGLLLRSGNDAAIALAEHVGKSIEGFAEMMNNKAKELNLTDTHFVTPHGLDDPNHYTTPTELAVMSDYALKNKTFANIVKKTTAQISINGNPKTLKNTNEILCSNVEGVYGVKTGFTNNAGRCLVTSVKRGDMDLIIVVLMADTRNNRASDTMKLIQYAYKEYRMEDLEEKINEEYENWKNINQNRIYIEKASAKIETMLNEIEIKKIATNKEISLECTSINYLEAPVKEGERIGTITIKNGDEIVEKVEIKTSKEIKRKGVISYLSQFAKTIAL